MLRACCPNGRSTEVVIKLPSFQSKEELIKIAWQKKGIQYEGRKVFLDHAYTAEVLKRRKEYAEEKGSAG